MSCLPCQNFISLYFETVDWSLTTQIRQWEKNVVLGRAGVCGEGRNTSSPKTPSWEVTLHITGGKINVLGNKRDLNS